MNSAPVTPADARRLRVAIVMAALAASPLPAQPPPPAIQVLLGDSARTTVSPGAPVRLPVRVALNRPRVPGLAALQLVARWDTAQLRLDSLQVVRGAPLAITVNPATGGSGLVRFNGFAATAIDRPAALLELFFTARLVRGAAELTLTLEAAGDEMGRDMAAEVAVRGHAVCAGSCAHREQPQG